MKVEILLFAALRDVVGQSQITLDLPENADAQSLRLSLQIKQPQLQKISFSVAINRRIVDSKTLIRSGDEVACIPPVSGG